MHATTIHGALQKHSFRTADTSAACVCNLIHRIEQHDSMRLNIAMSLTVTCSHMTRITGPAVHPDAPMHQCTAGHSHARDKSQRSAKAHTHSYSVATPLTTEHLTRIWAVG